MPRRIQSPTNELREQRAERVLHELVVRVFVPAIDGPLPADYVALQRRLRRELDRLERAGAPAVERLGAVLDFFESEGRPSWHATHGRAWAEAELTWEEVDR